MTEMNAATASFSVPTRTKLPPVASGEGPSFITRLVESLTWSFRLDAREQAVARALLCGHSLGSIAKSVDVDARAAQQLCKSLFGTTGTDGREQLFEVALRLTMMRELSSLFVARA
jgi:DNA-binding NarL/FixJ family response regulator